MNTRFLLLCTSALLLAACSPKVDNRGHVADENWKEKVIAGQTTQDEVTQVMGSPSARSSFGEDHWYYISGRKETVGPFKSEIAEQNVIDIAFDTGGVVKEIKTYDKDAGKDIAVVSRETPTEGHSLGFVEQLLGNVGRFNGGGRESGVAPGRRAGSGF